MSDYPRPVAEDCGHSLGKIEVNLSHFMIVNPLYDGDT
jgi:hypothetical protein